MSLLREKEADDRTRTDNIQLGKLAINPCSGRDLATHLLFYPKLTP